MTVLYEKKPQNIYRRSFEIIRDEAGDALQKLPCDLEPLVVRLMHSVGMTDLVDDLRFSQNAIESGVAALHAGKPILVDTKMLAGGISRAYLASSDGQARNEVILTNYEAEIPKLADALGTTKSAAAIELWRPYLDGAIVSIGNAPTALFRLLEILEDGAARPALIFGFPVGFVGAAESKALLHEKASSLGLDYVCMTGRRGGTPMACAAVNALALIAREKQVQDKDE